jgi:alkylhydroperoxidase family enzyme
LDCDRAGQDATLFNQAEQAVLHLTMAMTRHVQVSAEFMAATRAALGNDRELVELVGVIAAYNMVSRFLVALGIELEEEI